MAKAATLKVYRMAIGFHDAYVAAPSQKAAIEAWGSDKDAFARGRAELVDDPALMQAPLAAPGTIVKRLRGTAEEQIAALGEMPARKVGAEKAEMPKPKREPKPVPRPSRAALDEAEQALATAETEQAEARRELAEREATLAREREALGREQALERARLEARRDKADAAYEAAMRRWRG